MASTDSHAGHGFHTLDRRLHRATPASRDPPLAETAVTGLTGLTGLGADLSVATIRRLVTHPIWTALVLRDRHCAFPGCDRPPVMCHADHIRHWITGGDTKLANLALLCGHHHRVIHDSPWQIRHRPRRE